MLRNGAGVFQVLLTGPFHHGLEMALAFAIVMCPVAAVASGLRGGRVEHLNPTIPLAGPQNEGQDTGLTIANVNMFGYAILSHDLVLYSTHEHGSDRQTHPHKGTATVPKRLCAANSIPENRRRRVFFPVVGAAQQHDSLSSHRTE